MRNAARSSRDDGFARRERKSAMAGQMGSTHCHDVSVGMCVCVCVAVEKNETAPVLKRERVCETHTKRFQLFTCSMPAPKQTNQYLRSVFTERVWFIMDE